MTSAPFVSLPLLPRVLIGVAALALSSCSWFEGDAEKVPLPGERVSVLQLQRTLEPSDVAPGTAFLAPVPWKNEFWPQAGGYPNHAMQHPSLNPSELKKIWSADIGSGGSNDFPLMSQPIVFDGKVFVLDTESEVSAYDLESGDRLWKNTIRPDDEDEQVIGGGLSYSAKVLYATSGYNELLALNPEKGGIYWRVKLPSPSRAAPTILDGKIYITTLDSRLVALDAATGKQLWDYQALSETSGLVGAASPAASSDMVIGAFSSGELVALRPENGSVIWGDNLSPAVRVGGLSALPDIHALPVLDKGMAFGISFGGKMVALDERTGQRLWQKPISGAETPFVSGNAIFLVTSNGDLVALARDNGALLWVKPLAEYVREDGDKESAGNSLLWNGPVLAGGRLILGGPEGMVYEIDPVNGQELRAFRAGASLAVSPVVARETLLLLLADGTLAAYR
jgi:outer membrane protein assembly factor BamB